MNSAPLRVAFAIPSLDRGGAEGQLITLASGLVERGHAVLVATLAGGLADLAEERSSTLEVRRLARSRTPLALGALAVRMARTVRQFRPDILHGYLPAGNVAAALGARTMRRRPTVVFGVRGVVPRRGHLRRVRALYRAEAWASRFADGLIANSDAALESAVRRGVAPLRRFTVANGIDPRRFARDEGAGAVLRDEWGLSRHQILVGRVGALHPVKDYPSFLRSAAASAGRAPELRFVCVGGGSPDLQNDLRRMAEHLGLHDRLVWAGARADMTAVFSALDVAVSSSRAESFPNVLAEAMACGVPCVATDVGASSLIVGSTGEIVGPDDSVALGFAIDRLVARLQANGGALRVAARQRIVDHFSVEAMVDGTEEILLLLRRERVRRSSRARPET